MPNPVFVDLTKDSWTLVATGVVAGQIHKISHAPTLYSHTYRLTGEAAPTLESDGVLAFKGSEITEQISASAAIDVYMWANKADGRVRVDI